MLIMYKIKSFWKKIFYLIRVNETIPTYLYCVKNIINTVKQFI